MYGLTSREFRFALIICSAHFTQHVFFRIVAPLIPVLTVALVYPLWQLGLFISLYLLGMGIAQAPLGILADRYDRAYILPTGFVITGSAYVTFVAAPAYGIHIPAVSLMGHVFEGGFLLMALSMLLVGVGLAVVHPVGYPMITDNIRGPHKGKVLGAFGASSKLGDATPPAIIAVLLLVTSWQHIILGFGVAGIVFGVVLYGVLRDDAFETVPSGQRDTDDEGKGPNTGDTGPRTYLYPMLILYSFFIFLMLSTTALSAFLPTYIDAVYAYTFHLGSLQIGSESVANVYFAILLISGAVMQLVIGGLSDVYEPRQILVACMGIGTLGMVGLALFDANPLLLLLLIIVLGTGLYGVNPARDALISEFSPPDQEGRTFGYIWTAVTLTGVPLPTVIGYLLETVGMRVGFFLLAVGPLIAGLAITTLYSERVYLEKTVVQDDGTPER